MVRDYLATLRDGGSRYVGEVASWADRATLLESVVGSIDVVFGHNDLLASNLLDDGQRLWLIDWDYAGFNASLFDVGGLASNNGFDAAHERALLAAYFGRSPDGLLTSRYEAMKCASLLRETLWSMVSELTSKVSGVDFAAYTQENRARFEAAWAMFGK